jgi:hypothetical protein
MERHDMYVTAAMMMQIQMPFGATMGAKLLLVHISDGKVKASQLKKHYFYTRQRSTRSSPCLVAA